MKKIGNLSQEQIEELAEQMMSVKKVLAERYQANQLESGIHLTKMMDIVDEFGLNGKKHAEYKKQSKCRDANSERLLEIKIIMEMLHL